MSESVVVLDTHAAIWWTLEPARLGKRRHRGLNLLRLQEQTLFRAALRGEHHLNGFRNRDIQAALFPTPVTMSPTCSPDFIAGVPGSTLVT